MPKISVIIPVYNSISYIRKCIDSVAGQTIEDIEIIIVDAGSTDGTLEILESYQANDARIKLLHSDKKSVGYQYNLGIRNAKGKYLGFVESDDFIVPTMYENLLSYMECHDVDFVKSDFDVFVEREEYLVLHYNMLPRLKNDLYGKEFVPRDNPEFLYSDIFMWNGLYDADFIKRNNVRLNETPGASFQDTGFVMQSFCAARKAMYVQGESYKYRKDNLSASSYSHSVLQFVVWELEYAQSALVPQYKDDLKFLEVFCYKFWGIYWLYLGRIKDKDYNREEIQPLAKRFKAAFISMYQNFPFYHAHVSGLDWAFQQILSNAIVSDGTADLARYRYKLMSELWVYAGQYKTLIIFGAGKVGQCLYGLLRNNRFQGAIVFCDNSKDKWGTRLMGAEVIRPSEAVLHKDDVLFLIANSAHWDDIYEQLTDMEIPKENICRAMPCGPLETFEIFFDDWGAYDRNGDGSKGNCWGSADCPY